MFEYGNELRVSPLLRFTIIFRLYRENCIARLFYGFSQILNSTNRGDLGWHDSANLSRAHRIR